MRWKNFLPPLHESTHEAVEDGLKYLTDEDRKAIATYLLAQKPVVNEVKPGK